MKKKGILGTIGDTPLVELDIGVQPQVFAKIESANPGGSIKDRSACYLIERAEQEGLLRPGGTIIEASSGNQAAALAMIGAAKGYKVIITVPEKISQEKLATIKAYGAEVRVFPDDPHIYHDQAIKLSRQMPDAFMPNQYFNPLNAEAHYTWLGPELWKQTDGKITHLFAAAGTGGTVCGVGRFLKEKNPAINVIAIDSNCSYAATQGRPQPYKVEGMGINFPDSAVLDYSVIDEIVTVNDDDALGMLPWLATTQGLLVGLSSGAAVYVVREYAKGLADDAYVVVIFPDSGRAYLTKPYYTH